MFFVPARGVERWQGMLAIAQVQLADHVLLKGSIKALNFSDLMVQKDSISIQVYTEGESAILFQ